MDLTSCSIDWLHYARLTLAGQQKPPSGLHNLCYPEWIFTTQKPFPIISNSIIVVRTNFTRNQFKIFIHTYTKKDTDKTSISFGLKVLVTNCDQKRCQTSHIKGRY